MKLEAPFLSGDEICEVLGISRPTLYRWLKLGMPSHQVIERGNHLFVLDEVRAWIMSRCIAPTPDQGVA